MPCGQGDASAFTELAEPVQGTVFHGDGREEALLKHLQSLPELSADQTSSLSLYDRSQRVLDAIHEFGKAENRYLMSVGETKGRQVEEVLRERKAKVSCHFHFNAGAGRSYCRLAIGMEVLGIVHATGEWAVWGSDNLLRGERQTSTAMLRLSREGIEPLDEVLEAVEVWNSWKSRQR